MNRRTDRAVGALGFLASVAVLRLLSGTHAGPFITDEAGYLGNARWLAGTGGRWLMDTSPYYRWGYSLLLIPTQWITSDPRDQFRLVLVVNLALLASLFPILYTLVRRTLDPPVWVAAVAAGVAVVYPGVGVSSGMAMAENLLVPLFALSALAYLSFVRGQGALRWCFGLCVLGLWATHRRVVLVVVVALVAIGVAVSAERSRLRAGVVNAAVIVGGLVPVTLVDHVLVDERWLRIRRPEEFGGGWTTLATSPHDWVIFVQRMAGQTWYLLAGSLGLAAFGIVCLARAGAGGSLRSRLRDPVTLATWYQLAAVVAMAAITSVFFTLVTRRPDQRVYGRYTDMVVPPVLAAGVVWVLQRPWRQVVGMCGLALGVLAIALAVNLAPHGTANFQGPYPVNQVVAIAWLDMSSKVPVVAATLVAAVALVGMAVLAPLRGRLLALAGVVAVYAVAVHPVQSRIRGGQQYRNVDRTFPMQVDRVGDIDRFAFAIDQQSRGEAAVIQFWLPGKTMVPWGLGRPAPEPWAIAPIDSPRAKDAGARQIFRDVRVHSALWVLPGAEQRRMAAAGRLLPEDLSAPLPPSGRAGRLSVAGSRSLRGTSGEQLDVAVTVRNTGDQPWIDFGSYQGRGVVRLGVEGPYVTKPTSRSLRGRGDLKATLWPRQSSVVHVPVDLTGLRPGTHKFAVVVLQEGLGVFEQVRPLELTVEVTG